MHSAPTDMASYMYLALVCVGNAWLLFVPVLLGEQVRAIMDKRETKRRSLSIAFFRLLNL